MSANRDRVAPLMSQIERNKYDTEAWLGILRLIHNEDVEIYRESVYERLLKVFPSSGRFWRSYIDHEVRCSNFERVEKLFQRCLMKVLSIDLWKTYLSYVRETKASLPSYKEKMAQAYDFALDKMGMDFHAYSIWTDYIAFLKNVEAVGSYAENQKMTAIRKIYHRGVLTPMMNVEALWKEYLAFEQNINPVLADKMSSEKSRDYMQARRVAKEYEALTRGLKKDMLSVPPTGSPEETKQVELWTKYLNWEMDNPMRTEDIVGVTKRVMFAFEQCLLCLGHFSTIWHNAANYLYESSKALTEKGDADNAKAFLEQTTAVYERAISTYHEDNLTIYLAYADLEEQQMKNQKVHEVYQKFIGNKELDPSLCYIHYMRFCRRCEGTTSARAIFKKARDDPRSSFHIYVAAALMEFFCSKDKKIASNIFELAFKKYKHDPKFVTHYLDFLTHLNDDNNTRVLFERVLSTDELTPENAKPIWTQFMNFESTVGDLSSIKKVETRMMSNLNSQTNKRSLKIDPKNLIERYKVFDLLPSKVEELVATTNGTTGVQDSKSKDQSKKEQAPKAATKVSKLAKPDISQMTPFKPSVKWNQNTHQKLPGGEFAMPPALADLCTILPPPDCYQGPFVHVNRLIQTIQNCRPRDPSSIHRETPVVESKEMKKRPKKEEFSDEENGDDVPAQDLYRQRQRRKIK